MARRARLLLAARNTLAQLVTLDALTIAVKLAARCVDGALCGTGALAAVVGAAALTESLPFACIECSPCMILQGGDEQLPVCMLCASPPLCGKHASRTLLLMELGISVTGREKHSQ